MNCVTADKVYKVTRRDRYGRPISATCTGTRWARWRRVYGTRPIPARAGTGLLVYGKLTDALRMLAWQPPGMLWTIWLAWGYEQLALPDMRAPFARDVTRCWLGDPVPSAGWPTGTLAYRSVQLIRPVPTTLCSPV